SFAMKMWSDVNAGSVAVGDTKTVTVVTPGQVARFTFAAAIGDQLGFGLPGVTLPAGGSIQVLNPGGGSIFSTSFNTSGLPVVRLPVLSIAGTYTVVVTPTSNGAGSYAFTLWKDVSGGALTIDAPTPTTATVVFAGQLVRLTFDATAGMQLGFGLTNV